MESVKSSLINFCKGFGIWFLLLLFNTRGGEADVNGFKIVLGVVLMKNVPEDILSDHSGENRYFDE